MRIRNAFEYFFCLRSNLSNFVTQFLPEGQEENRNGFQRSCLKKGLENYMFWSEIGSGFGEPGGTPPTRIPRITPRDLKASHGS